LRPLSAGPEERTNAIRHKLQVNVGAPQVAFRDLVRSTEIDYTHKKQTDGAGQFARVKLRLELTPDSQGVGTHAPGPMPNDFFPSLIGEALLNGLTYAAFGCASSRPLGDGGYARR
jgi:translation elongation factor EF-G